MRIMAWNCRGLNASDGPTVQYLCWIIQIFSPHILFLNETKADSVVISWLSKS